MHFKYKVETGDTGEFEIPENILSEDELLDNDGLVDLYIEVVSEFAAQDFYDNVNPDIEEWPLNFEIYTDEDEKLFEVAVDFDLQPTFYFS